VFSDVAALCKDSERTGMQMVGSKATGAFATVRIKRIDIVAEEETFVASASGRKSQEKESSYKDRRGTREERRHLL